MVDQRENGSSSEDGASEEDVIAGYVGEIEELLEEFPTEDDHFVDTAVHTCSVERAIDSGLSKEEFLDLVGRMFEECKTMDEFEDVMSPGGDA